MVTFYMTLNDVLSSGIMGAKSRTLGECQHYRGEVEGMVSLA